jgi:lipopolysaccharide transport system permease protein
VTIILTVWFWMTPIFIFENQIPARLQIVVYANPLASIVRAYRQVLLGRQVLGWRDAGSLAVVSVSAFFLGGLVFRHLKRGFADVL